MLCSKTIRKDFPMFANNPDLVYLDSAATTFKPQTVIDRVNHYYTHQSVNIGRGEYDLSHDVAVEYEGVREKVANFINAKSSQEIIFTSGASAALNLVAHGWGLKHLKEGDVIVTTEAEHASNILPWFKVAEATGATIKYVPLEADGAFTLDNFKSIMDESVKVVTLANVSNVLGYQLPTKEICSIAHEVGAKVIIDGAQSVPHLKTDVTEWDADFLAFAGHKMCGPTGVGVLYGKSELLEQMDPEYYGGGSNARYHKDGDISLKKAPAKFESGTPAIEAVLGLGAAIDYINDLGFDKIMEYEHALHEYMIEEVSKLEHVIVYNKAAESGIMTFNVKGIFSQDAASYLNSLNIAVRSGHHCSKIIGDVIGSADTLRASIYFYNTKEDVDQLVEGLKTTTIENCIDLFV